MKIALVMIIAIVLLLLGILSLSSGIIFSPKQVVIICGISFATGMGTGGFLAWRLTRKPVKRVEQG